MFCSDKLPASACTSRGVYTKFMGHQGKLWPSGILRHFVRSNLSFGRKFKFSSLHRACPTPRRLPREPRTFRNQVCAKGVHKPGRPWLISKKEKQLQFVIYVLNLLRVVNSRSRHFFNPIKSREKVLLSSCDRCITAFPFPFFLGEKEEKVE